MTNRTLPTFDSHNGVQLAALLVGCLFGIVAAPAQAQCTTTWTHAANGSWWTASNWTPATVPNSAAETVCIIDGSSIVQLNAGAGVGSLQIATGNSLQILNGTGLAMAGVPSSTINNAGTIALQSTGGAADLIINNGSTVTLSGGGLVTLSNNTNNRIYTNVKGSVLDNVDNRISGAGQIFKNAGMVLKNQVGGVIEASGTNALRLDNFSGIDTGVDYTLVNNGILRATNTGGLVLQNTTVDNTGNGNSGRITALGDGFHVDLQGASIRGGTLSTSGTGVIQTVGSGNLLDGSTAAVNISGGSLLRVNNGHAVSLLGTINNAGTIALSSIGSVADLIIGAGTVTLQGGGQITLSNNINNRIYGNPPSASLLDNVDHTISGAGQIFSNGFMTLRNQAAGVIDASAAGSLTLSGFTGAFTLVNDGILRSTNTTAGNDGLILQNTTVNNTGNSNGGRITAIGANTHVDLNGATIVGGTLTTSGGGVIQTVGNGGALDGSTAAVNITSGSTIRVNNARTLTLLGTINNAGTIALSSIGSTTDLLVAGGSQLTGGGAITLTSNTNNRIFGSANTGLEVVTNVDNTIAGAGQIGAGQSMLVINQAVINANGTVALTITPTSNNTTGLITANGGGFVNQGLLEASNTGGLVLSGGQFNNFGGTIQAVGSGSEVRLQSNVTVSGGALAGNSGGSVRTITGNTASLDGTSQGALTIAGAYVAENNTSTFLSGTINNTGTIAVSSGGSLTDLRVAGGTQLTGGGAIALSNNGNNRIWGAANTGLEVLTNVDNTISGAGQIGAGQSIRIVNSGTIDATGTVALNVSPSTNAALTEGLLNQSGGTVRGSGTGGLNFTQGKFTNQGTVEALANSKVVFQSGATVTNLTSNVLTGGIWKANSVGGSSALIDFQGTNTVITSNAADIYLIGANSTIQGRTVANAIQSLDSTLFSNSGALRLQQGRNLTAIAASGNFSNTGLIEVTDSTFRANNTLANSGTIVSFGNSTVGTVAGNQITGTGSISASFGTLSVTHGVNMGAGSSMTSNAGATIDLSGAALASQIGTLGNNGALNLGAQNIVVTKDYTNANFGVGNSFNARANVSGAGLVIGNLASQTITGDVTAAGANTWTLNLGNVRGGTSKTVNYQIGNSGTGADIRGAVQTAGPNGGNVTDARLSGSGATAANFAPIAAGGNSGNLAVTFNATSGGPLSGQTIVVVSNFDNVAKQTISLNGTATTLAQGNATPSTNPVNLGNFRVGGTQPSQAFGVANTSPAASTTEQLGIASAGTTGNFSAVNNLGAGFIAGGGSQPNAVAASVNGGVAGVNNGTLAIQYTTNGALIDPSFTTINANSQAINLQATGYNAAVGSAAPAGTVNVGNARVGGTLAQTLTVTNTAPAGSYSEDLNAAFGTNTGHASNNGGSISGLLAGANNSAAMSGSLSTTTAGARTGTVTINYETSGKVGGSAISGLSPASAGSQTITLNGGVYQEAQRDFASTSINLGNVRVGGTAQQALSVANTNIAPVGYQEGLTASIGGATAGITAGGSFTNLAAGATNNTSLLVGLDTTASGAKSGTASVSLTSTGAGTSGLADLALAPQVVNVSGNVFQVASGQVNTAPLNFGTVQVGQSVQQTLSISNIATGAAGHVEDLNASFGATSGTNGNLILGSGSISGLVAGGTNASNMVVTVNTSAAATISGAIAVNFVSAGTVGGTSNGLGTLAVGSANYGVSGVIQTGGQVINQAVPVINNSPINLGNVRVGAASPIGLVSVTNQATTAPQAALNASIAGNAPITASGSFNLLLPGATNNTSLQVGMNTGSAGAINGTATIAFVSDASNVGGCAPNCQLPLASQNVTVTGGVFQIAQPNVPASVNLGNFRLGSAPTQAITIGNTNSAPAGYQEGLDASIGGTAGKATASGGPISNLAQGGTSNAISVGINSGTATAGVNSGTVTLTMASNGTGTSGLPTLGLADAVVNVSGTGYRLANPTLNTPTVTIAARVGDPVAANRAVSITNTSPDVYTEGLKVGVTGAAGNAQHNGGSIPNLAAQATNATAIQVGLASTATAGQSTGSVSLKFDSTGAGTTGAPDTDAQTASGIVNVIGNIYQRAVGAVVGAIDFGIVRVGQVVGAKDATVGNTATLVNGGTYNDTLAAQFASSGVGKFSTSGSASGIAAGGGTNAAGSMTVGLNTGQAGNLSETQQVNFRGQNGAMADDLTLSSGSLIMTAQVNNWADPVFGKTSGAGIFSCSGLVCSLNLGDIVQGSGPLATELFLKNDAVNPADSLKGIFDLSLVDDFAQSGWTNPTDLTPGAVLNGLALTYDPLSLGAFSDTIYFDGFSFNSSDPNGAALSRFTLNLYANVVQQGGSAPEPGTIAMILLAAGLAYGARRRQTKAH